MSGRGVMFRRRMACVVVGTLVVAAPLAARAQSCSPGYYYASDGYCYPGPPPSYPPPAYDAAPPVAAPPVVMDGLLIGLGMVLGGALLSDHGGPRGRPEEHRPPPRRGHR